MSPKIAIIGAGYAGVSAAKRFARSNLPVTLVNPRPVFVERIRLHELVAGTRSATVPLTSLLPRSTTLVQNTAQSVNIDQRTVMLTNGDIIEFDYLVYAVGSRGRLDTVPGASEHAVAVGGLEDATAARQRFSRLPEASSITVVGGGLTGVELACELAESGDHAVRLVTDESVASSVSDKGRAYLRHHLATLGVEIFENTAVAEIQAAKVVLEDGRALDSDLSVMTAQVELPTLAGDSGLATDGDGALKVSSSLVSTSAPTVVGAGDAARMDAAPVRMSCQAAIPLGTHAAETILHLINGTEPLPVRPKFTSQCISLGRNAALWQHTNHTDRPTSLTVTGRAGALIKEQICAGTLRYALNPRLQWLTYGWS
jgi:NADH dehydrogenase